MVAVDGGTIDARTIDARGVADGGPDAASGNFIDGVQGVAAERDDPRVEALYRMEKPSTGDGCTGADATYERIYAALEGGSDSDFERSGVRWYRKSCTDLTGCSDWMTSDFVGQLMVGPRIRPGGGLALELHAYDDPASHPELNQLFTFKQPDFVIGGFDWMDSGLAAPDRTFVRLRFTENVPDGVCLEWSTRLFVWTDGTMTLSYFGIGRATFSRTEPASAASDRPPASSMCDDEPASDDEIGAGWFAPGSASRVLHLNDPMTAERYCNPYSGCSAWLPAFAPLWDPIGVLTVRAQRIWIEHDTQSFLVTNGRFDGTHGFDKEYMTLVTNSNKTPSITWGRSKSRRGIRRSGNSSVTSPRWSRTVSRRPKTSWPSEKHGREAAPREGLIELAEAGRDTARHPVARDQARERVADDAGGHGAGHGQRDATGQGQISDAATT
jgi:hypothetical protein